MHEGILFGSVFSRLLARQTLAGGVQERIEAFLAFLRQTTEACSAGWTFLANDYWH
jgi:hypothetical protein